MAELFVAIKRTVHCMDCLLPAQLGGCESGHSLPVRNKLPTNLLRLSGDAHNKKRDNIDQCRQSRKML